MKTTVKEITPQWASKILESHNPKNRPISMATVRSYATDMKAGHWPLSPQTISFNEAGDLIDGQHRLMACIEAQVPFQSLVVTEVPASQKSDNNGMSMETQDIIDRHRVRSIGQQLVLSHGWTSGNRVAAVARGIALFFTSDGNSLRITTPQTLAILELWGDSVRAMMALNSLNPARANAKFLAAGAIYHVKYPKKCLEFMESFLSGIGWTKGCPHKALDAWRTHNKLELSGGRREGVCAAAVALYYFHRSEEVHILRIASEATKWLSNLNPELRESVIKLIQ